MSIQAVAAVLDHSRSKHGARLTLISLANHADKNGICFPSIKKAAAEALLSPRAVTEAVGQLRDELSELVILVEADGKTHRPPLYWITLPGLSGEFDDEHPYFVVFGPREDLAPPRVQISHPGGVRTSPLPPCEPRTPPGAKSDSALYREPSKEPSDNRVVVATKSSTVAWERAKSALFERLNPESFDCMRELVVVGERDGALVLVDGSDRCSSPTTEQRAKPLILEALDGFDAVEILDEFELSQTDVDADPAPWSPAIAEALPGVAEALGRICEVRQLPFPAIERIGAALEAYPTADHAAVVSDMEDWLCSGDEGKRWEVKDLVQTLRGQLSRKRGEPAGGSRRRGGEHPADARIRELNQRLAGDVVDATVEEAS